jgi:hypothetical protein
VRAPLEEIRNQATGVLGYQPVITLTLRTTGDTEEEQRFIFDTGATVSVMSLARAEELRLPVLGPDEKVVLAHRTAEAAEPVERRIRPGRLRVSIPGLRPDPFDWPCYFRPDLPKGAPSLLGLAGVLEDLRLTLDGVRSSGGVFFGYLLLELRTPVVAPAASPGPEATPPS